MNGNVVNGGMHERNNRIHSIAGVGEVANDNQAETIAGARPDTGQ